MTPALTFAGYVVILLAMLVHEIRARRAGRATIDDALDFVMRSPTRAGSGDRRLALAGLASLRARGSLTPHVSLPCTHGRL